MRALAYNRFGGLAELGFTDLPEPEPRAGEVLVAVSARSINAIDLKIMAGKMGPLVSRRFPKVPGADFAGTVVAIGKGVTDVQIGQRVYGAADVFKGGSFAERIAVPARQVAALPDALADDVAASLPIAGLAALKALRDLGGLMMGQRVLVHGATGPVGLFAIQIAKAMGAPVTAVAGAGLDAAAKFGADTLIDYRAAASAPAGPFDVILNLSGQLPWRRARALLAPRGRLVEAAPTIPQFIGATLGNLVRRRAHMPLATSANRRDLTDLATWVSTGKLQSTIAARFPFDQSIDAMALMAKGGVVGKIVVTD